MKINTYHEIGLTDTEFNLEPRDEWGEHTLTITKHDYSQIGYSRIEHEIEIEGTPTELAAWLSKRGGRLVRETTWTDYEGKTHIQLPLELREAILKELQKGKA